MKHTRQQVENSICKWSGYLLENKLASEAEVKQMLGEGLFKRAKTYVKNAFKHVGQGIASGAKKVGLKVHDTFAANKGVAKLMDAVAKLMDKGIDAEDIKLYVSFKKKTYAIADFALAKNRKTLALLFDDKAKKTKTYEELEQFMLDNKITGNDKRITDFVDSLIIGQIENGLDSLNESKKSSAQQKIAKVLEVLGWDSKKALKDDNIENVMNLLGMKNKTTVAQEIADYYKSKGEKGVDDPTISSDDPASDFRDDKSDSADDDEKDAEEDAEEKPDFDKEENTPKTETMNTALMKTTDGDTVGVMDNAFLNVLTKGNAIGIMFDMPKAEIEKKKRQRVALKH